MQKQIILTAQSAAALLELHSASARAGVITSCFGSCTDDWFGWLYFTVHQIPCPGFFFTTLIFRGVLY